MLLQLGKQFFLFNDVVLEVMIFQILEHLFIAWCLITEYIKHSALNLPVLGSVPKSL